MHFAFSISGTTTFIIVVVLAWLAMWQASIAAPHMPGPKFLFSVITGLVAACALLSVSAVVLHP